MYGPAAAVLEAGLLFDWRYNRPLAVILQSGVAPVYPTDHSSRDCSARLGAVVLLECGMHARHRRMRRRKGALTSSPQS